MIKSLENYKNKNILITGGASFIGSHLTELLLKNGANISVIDNLSSGKLENLKEVLTEIEFIEDDVRKDGVLDSVLKKKYDFLFNLAAIHGGRGFIDTHPVECTNNMLLDHKVFEYAANNEIATIVHASSACVYPTNLQANESDRYLLSEDDANFDEPGKAFSDGEYGWAKLMGELQLKAFTKQYKINGVAGRIFTAYGERENESHAAIALIAKAVLKMEPYPIWGTGNQTRNFTYVADTVYGLALSGINITGFDAVNIGTSSHNSINELCSYIFEYLNWKPNNFDFQLDKPVGVKSRASDNRKINQLLAWEPKFSLRDGIFRTLDWYISNIDKNSLKNLENKLMER